MLIFPPINKVFFLQASDRNLALCPLGISFLRVGSDLYGGGGWVVFWFQRTTKIDPEPPENKQLPTCIHNQTKKQYYCDSNCLPPTGNPTNVMLHPLHQHTCKHTWKLQTQAPDKQNQTTHSEHFPNVHHRCFAGGLHCGLQAFLHI